MAAKGKGPPRPRRHPNGRKTIDVLGEVVRRPQLEVSDEPISHGAPARDVGIDAQAPEAPKAHESDEPAVGDAESEPQDEPTADPAEPADPLGHLDLKHRRLIEESSILTDVAVERGYRSVAIKERLKTLGFKPRQCGVPTLLIPLWGVNGEIAGYQVRPDVPRVGAGGKPLKYEFPQGARMVVDVHPRVRALLSDPKVPLIITEGVRKADSAVSRGLLCVSLLGVWNWRGTNEDGGKTILPDFESIALNGRKVYIAYDSDVVSKRGVRAAMARLKAALKVRGANVEILRLPDGPGGAKIGLDDFFALAAR